MAHKHSAFLNALTDAGIKFTQTNQDEIGRYIKQYEYRVDKNGTPTYILIVEDSTHEGYRVFIENNTNNIASDVKMIEKLVKSNGTGQYEIRLVGETPDNHCESFNLGSKDIIGIDNYDKLYFGLYEKEIDGTWKHIKDSESKSELTKYMEVLREQHLPHVALHVKGGMIQRVISDSDMSILVIDSDIDGDDSSASSVPHMDIGLANVYVENVIADAEQYRKLYSSIK